MAKQLLFAVNQYLDLQSFDCYLLTNQDMLKNYQKQLVPICQQVNHKNEGYWNYFQQYPALNINKVFSIIINQMALCSTYNHTNTYQNRNQVRDSMISMVSEAFEFEDFLGETTILKDKVPKNKNKQSIKSIVHFSREVAQDYTNINPLNIGAHSFGFDKKNTFDEYIHPESRNIVQNPNQCSSSYQTDYLNRSKREQFVSTTQSYENENRPLNNALASQNYSSTWGVNFKTQNPVKLSNYVDSYSNYSIQDPLFESKQNGHISSYSSYSNYQPSSQYSCTSSAQTNNWDRQPYKSQSYQSYQQPVKPSVQTQQECKKQNSNNNYNYSYDTTYEKYGEYAKDFSSPAILAILKKRSIDTRGNSELGIQDTNIPKIQIETKWNTNY